MKKITDKIWFHQSLKKLALPKSLIINYLQILPLSSAFTNHCHNLVQLILNNLEKNVLSFIFRTGCPFTGKCNSS
jgi:RNase adaptor protein for sRNA GlmZ degradation